MVRRTRSEFCLLLAAVWNPSQRCLLTWPLLIYEDLNALEPFRVITASNNFEGLHNILQFDQEVLDSDSA